MKQRKVFTQKQIVVGTLVGGIFTAGYMLASNFKTFNLATKARSTWFIAVAYFLFITSTAFIPVLDKVPGLVFTFATFAIVYIVFDKLQLKQVSAYMEAGGKPQSNWTAFWLTLLGIAIVAGIILGAFLLQDLPVSEIH